MCEGTRIGRAAYRMNSSSPLNSSISHRRTASACPTSFEVSLLNRIIWAGFISAVLALSIAHAKAVAPSQSGSGFTIDRQSGVFRDRDGRTVTPVGVNYWPASCGVEMWKFWPEAEIRHDLDVVRSLGLNCVRFFLRWEDFEPQPGVYDPKAFQHLEEMLRWHRERGLLAHPSFFVGWMSGGVFWPEWRRGRNIFSDPEMRQRAIAFAEKAAAICADFPDTVIAIDQGNELVCLDDSIDGKPSEVASWCHEVSAAIKRRFPGALVVSGNEQNQILSDHCWRLGDQPGTDFLSMHAYPIGAWHSVNFDGLTDPLGQSLLPFYVKCARAFAPVMLQEFGTLLTRGEHECDAYLRAVLPAARAAGANGFLYWCLRDITATGHPYNKNAFEGSLGLVDAHDRIKPGLQYFLEFATHLKNSPTVPFQESSVALYWPREYYSRDNPLNPGNDPRTLSRQLAVANFTLGQLGQVPTIVRGDQPLETKAVIVITGAKLTGGEVTALTEWVRAGGRLIWHGLDPWTWGHGTEVLLGAEPIDFRAPTERHFAAFGSNWSVNHFARDSFLRVRLREAQLVAADHEDNPTLFVRQLGQGRVIACLAEMDAQFADQSVYPAEREKWGVWYRQMLKLAGSSEAP